MQGGKIPEVSGYAKSETANPGSNEQSLSRLSGNWIPRPDRLDERTECKENIQWIFLVKRQVVGGASY